MVVVNVLVMLVLLAMMVILEMMPMMLMLLMIRMMLKSKVAAVPVPQTILLSPQFSMLH